MGLLLLILALFLCALPIAVIAAFIYVSAERKQWLAARRYRHSAVYAPIPIVHSPISATALLHRDTHAQSIDILTLPLSAELRLHGIDLRGAHDAARVHIINNAPQHHMPPSVETNRKKFSPGVAVAGRAHNYTDSRQYTDLYLEHVISDIAAERANPQPTPSRIAMSMLGAVS
jgi:hypothetical protein